jgi:hypothetical protein
MCERERPKTEVRRSMRDAAKAEFDRVDHLVDHHLTKVVLLLSRAMITKSTVHSRLE